MYPTYEPKERPISSKSLRDIMRQLNRMSLIIISMNKQNQFVGSFNPWNKSQHKRLLEPDNSVLQVVMSENVRKQILDSQLTIEKGFEYYLDQISIFESDFKISKEYILIQTPEELNQAQQILGKQTLVFIKIFEETHRSFKGFCTWISITTNTQTYLIDLMILRTEVQTKGILLFSNPNILKIGLHMKQQIESLQRDFKIFPRTILDLNEMTSLCGIPADLRSLLKQHFPKFSTPQKLSESYYKRPSNHIDLQYMKICSQVLIDVLVRIRKGLSQNKTIFEAFLISNKQCLTTFQCQLSKYSLEFEQTLKQLNPRQQRICRKLLKWRIHNARIRDESPEFILPSRLIHLILDRNLKSMGELISLYDQLPQKQLCRDYDQTILDIINSQPSKIDITKCQADVNECKSINDFVRMIGWSDCNWKNSNSESVRLFKEIISMDPIQSSIFCNELNETKNRALSNEEVMDVFGYVQYFAKNDSKGLETQHNKIMKTHKSKSQSEQSIQGAPNQEFKIPESIQQIYQLANNKKKVMKKDKKKSVINEQKEEPFVLNVQEFLQSIGWN